MKVSVTILERHGESVLVEWRDEAGLHRAFVPQTVLEGESAERERLEQGVPYGEHWELLPLGNVGAEQIAQALRERNIWSKADARMNLSGLRAALQHAYAHDLKIILESIRK